MKSSFWNGFELWSFYALNWNVILGLVSCSFVGGNAIIQTVDYVTFNAAIVKVFRGSSSLCHFNKICNF